MNEKEQIRYSKFLSLVLRHQPELIDIQLDEQGWVDVQTLLTNAQKQNIQLSFEALEQLVEHNPKKRFAFDETKTRIRANQGHSVEVDLGYQPQQPPEVLFHGTAEKSVAAIRAKGLLKRDRHHVHLSTDIETALKVGQRHGKPFIFKVLAGQMHRDHFEFFISDNGVWLTDHVPAQYLSE